jgi:release factor glutamine methyltransferase
MDLLQRAAQFLSQKGVPNPRLDAEVLLSHVLGCRRIDLYLRHDQPLRDDEIDSFRELIRRRGRREPVAYITGQKEFWSLTFTVNSAVLIPRPETELLVELSIRFIRRLREEKQGPISVLDVGTGCGAIALAIASETDEGVSIVATDVSSEALKVASQNASALNLHHRVCLLQGDLFSPLVGSQGEFHLIVSNPPYIARSEFAGLPPEVRDFEPRLALDGGEDGLHFIRSLLEEGPLWLDPTGAMFLEVGEGHKAPIEVILRELDSWGHWSWESDLAGTPRVLSLRPSAKDKGTVNTIQRQADLNG